MTLSSSRRHSLLLRPAGGSLPAPSGDLFRVLGQELARVHPELVLALHAVLWQSVGRRPAVPGRPGGQRPLRRHFHRVPDGQAHRRGQAREQGPAGPHVRLAPPLARHLRHRVFSSSSACRSRAHSRPVPSLPRQRRRNRPAPREEFKVSESMVNLLYFQQLALVAYPYFPYSSIFCALFFYINFKFEKVGRLHSRRGSGRSTRARPSHLPAPQWTLSRFMQKPLKPWSAKDSGAFFIKFYLSSVIVLISSSVFFLSNRTFPKVRRVLCRSPLPLPTQCCCGAGVRQVRDRLQAALWGHNGTHGAVHTCLTNTCLNRSALAPNCRLTLAVWRSGPSGLRPRLLLPCPTTAARPSPTQNSSPPSAPSTKSRTQPRPTCLCPRPTPPPPTSHSYAPLPADHSCIR